MTEATIIKTQIIVVNEVGQNTYGDMTFTDKEGNPYKISSKRKQYFEKIIVPDVAVQLSYAMSSFGKEYIYSAIQVKDKLPALASEPVPAPDKIPKEPIPPKPEPAPQAIGMTTKEIGDMIRAKYLVPIFGNEIANELIKWYQSQILGTTRVPFDSSKLPQFMVKSIEKEVKTE